MFSEPSPRELYFSAPVEGEFCVWGGRTKSFTGQDKNDFVFRSTVHRFSPVQESWTQQICNGPPPPGLYEGACTYFAGRQLYFYGGTDGKDRQCSLHQLDMLSMTWKQLSRGPSRKDGCEMVIHMNKLILFGGYGDPLASVQPAQWDGNCTSELHTFDLEEGERVGLKA